jgi:hypothetical protein
MYVNWNSLCHLANQITARMMSLFQFLGISTHSEAVLKRSVIASRHFQIWTRPIRRRQNCASSPENVSLKMRCGLTDVHYDAMSRIVIMDTYCDGMTFPNRAWNKCIVPCDTCHHCNMASCNDNAADVCYKPCLCSPSGIYTHLALHKHLCCYTLDGRRLNNENENYFHTCVTFFFFFSTPYTQFFFCRKPLIRYFTNEIW